MSKEKANEVYFDKDFNSNLVSDFDIESDFNIVSDSDIESKNKNDNNSISTSLQSL